MLSSMLKIIHPGNRRTIVNWDRYVLSLGLRTEPFKTRFLLAPFRHSPFAKLLMEILLNVDTKFLLTVSNDFDMYTQYVEPMESEFRTMFDPVHNQNLYNLFANRLNSKVEEFILNVERVNPMNTLPFDKPWEEWEHLDTVKILYHDSPELITDLNSFQIDFKSKDVTHLIASIEISATIVKWVKYVEHCISMGETLENVRVEPFIQNHIMLSWFADLQRIWITNILTLCMTDKMNIKNLISDQIIAPDNMLLSSIGDVYHVIADAKRKSLRLNDFLATEWYGDYSIYDWLNGLLESFSCPKLRQYTYLQFMSEFPYLKLVLYANNVIGTHDAAKMSRDILYLLRRYTDARVWNNVLNIPLRNKIQREMIEIQELAKMNPYL